MSSKFTHKIQHQQSTYLQVCFPPPVNESVVWPTLLLQRDSTVSFRLILIQLEGSGDIKSQGKAFLDNKSHAHAWNMNTHTHLES